MTNILNKINSLFPISDDTVQILKENVTYCRFPKKYQLIKADTYCKSAFFIEKGITRSFWLVDGEEITTSFAGEGSIVFSMDELYYGNTGRGGSLPDTAGHIDASFRNQHRAVQLGKNHSPKRIQTFTPQPQRPSDLVGKGTIRSVQRTVSGRIPPSELRIHRLLSGHQALHTQPAPIKRIAEFDIGQIFYPQKQIHLPHITNI